MLPFISKGSAYGVQIKLPQGSFYWYENYEIDVQEKELLRLEAKFFQYSLEAEEESGINLCSYFEKKARGIKKSGSSLLVDKQVKKNLEALEGDAKFLNLLRSGFSEPTHAGKIWGGDKYKEMVIFTKQRFGPAYALLIICIFGTGGRRTNSRLTMNQLAKIIKCIGQSICYDNLFLYCPELENFWNRLVKESTDDHACTPLLSDGITLLQAGARISGDLEETSTHCSSQNWHATVMNEDISQPVDIGFITWSTRRRQLIVLVHFMGRDYARDDILRRGLFPQYRWDRNGDPTAAFQTDIMEFEELFVNNDTFDREIHNCINDGLVKRSMLEDGTQCYTLKRGLESCLPDYSRQLWVALFAFTAYIYPRDPALEQSFHAIGKRLMPVMDQLWECLREGDSQDLPYVVRSSFIEASLSACRLVNAARAKSILMAVRRLQVPSVPPYLAAMFTWQESVSLRWEGNHNESDTVLDSIFSQLPDVSATDLDIRLHCAYGCLAFSRAENAILRNDFVRACEYLDRWESRREPRSMMEMRLTRLFNTVFGRVARYTGKFPYARECFERCLCDSEPSYRHIKFHLADIYCELGLAEAAKGLLLKDVKQLRHTQSQKLKAFRRLALPLAEAHINLRDFTAARHTLEEVLRVYESMTYHDVTDQLGHVRTIISLARVDWYEHEYSGADERLKRAALLVESYSTFITRGFDFAFITLFHSVVKRALASELLSKVSRGYFMAGNGTYFFEEISSCVYS